MRPIQGMTILTAVLARWVNQIITQIIHPDQTGFIAGRYQQDKKSESIIKSLDAQKAFDQVSLLYLLQTLKDLALIL